MIAKLNGVVDATGEGWAIIDVGGVGYLVFCSGRTLAHLTAGAPVRLWIDTLMREDAIHLYGFADVTEREWFRLLNTVQGVGAKAALAVSRCLRRSNWRLRSPPAIAVPSPWRQELGRVLPGASSAS